MKKIIIIGLIFLIHEHGFSQCNNNVSTDPNNPSNSALPDVPGLIPNEQDNRYLNGFDWIKGNDVPSNDEYKLTDMWYNPGQSYSNMANIQNGSLGGNYLYLNKALGAEEMSIENGWELMLVNLGMYPDDVTDHTQTTLDAIPYIVLYNKYRGVLRVFVQYGYNQPPAGSVNGVKIDLLYQVGGSQNNLSGIFRLAEGNDRALNEKTEVKQLTAIAPKIGQTKFWMSGDFQLAYDPCVCFHPSNISLNFTFFSESDFKLYGRSVTVQESLIDNADILDKGFLSNVDYTEGTSENGLIIYNKIETLIEDYIAKMEVYNLKLAAANEHNAEVEKNIIIAKAVVKIVKVGVHAAIGTGPILALQGNLSEFFFSDTTSKSKEKVKKMFTSLEEMMGKKMDTYISKNFKPTNLPTKPVAPTASFSEMHFSGKLLSNTPTLGPLFHTPGSFRNESGQIDLPVQAVYGYPIFNNPVGVFALLKTPKIKYSKKNKEIVEYSTDAEITPFIPEIHSGQVFVYSRNYAYQSWTTEYQFQLAEDLVYAFNNSLDIKEYDISASFVVNPKFVTKPTAYSLPGQTKVLTSYIDLNNTINNTAYYSNGVNYTPIFPAPSYVSGNFFMTSPIDIMSNQANYFGFDNSVDALNFYETPFIPIESFKPFVSSIALKNECYRDNKILKRIENHILGVKVSQTNYSVAPMEYISLAIIEETAGLTYEFKDSINLKLKIDVVFNSLNDDGENNRSTFIFTYKIDPETMILQESELVQNLGNSSGNITQYNKDLYFENVTFNGSSVDGCKLIGNVYTCQAWNDISLSGNIIVNTGYLVRFQAGNEISEVPNSMIQGEIIREIKPVLNDSQPMPEASSTYVNNFCKGSNPNGSNYVANMSNKSGVDINSNPQLLEEKTPEREFLINLYPNPAFGTTTVEINGNEASNARISVFDITGKELNIKIVRQGNKFELDISTLSKGIYLVKVSTFGESKTKQLIIQ